MTLRREIRFILNGEDVSLDAVRPDETLLDFIRLKQRLTGTKEGCAEGDCGACTVLVGRLKAGELVYESVNACIRFTASVDRCHVVTIEHLKRADGALHPVQQAMVDFHGSQCGFCTPGFVMSLYALWMRSPDPGEREVERALQGNLCRCTGYEAIVRAARAVSSYGDGAGDVLARERGEVIARLGALDDGRRVEVASGDQHLLIPADVADLAAILTEQPTATIVAGATDVGLWVTKRFRSISPAVFIGNLDELEQIGEAGGVLTIGALASYTAARRELAKRIPAFAPLIDRIGGEQVRNMGTVGGNIANGSPIGDMPPPLIALGATLVLRSADGERRVPLEDFFVEYGKQDRRPVEFVERIEVPLPKAGAHVAFHKVTKRRDEDITATLGAFHVEVEDGVVSTARIAYGGMAGTPKRAKAVEAALMGQPWTMETIEAAMARMPQDFTPLSDMRASAEYRMLAAQNLLKRFWLETTGTKVPLMVTREKAA